MSAAVDVPVELVEDILSRVPVKSLLRFKTASKKWYSLLSQNHQFANFHLKIRFIKDNNLISHQANSTFIFRTSGTKFEYLNLETNASRKFNFPVQIDTKQCQLIGSANGLVCVTPSRRGGCYIWNPCTDECKRIPVPVSNSCGRVLGFGYDSCLDDYKIAANWGNHFRVFSLKTNSWKIFQCAFHSMLKAFHLNGALHWCIPGYLISFDLAKEVFSRLELPDKNCARFPDKPLWEHQGLLYLSGFSSNSIWMLKESSHGRSWVKSDTIFLAKKCTIPLGISTLGEVVYRGKGGSEFVKSDIHGGSLSDDDKSRIYYPFASVYTESLISPKCFGDDGLRPHSKKKMIKRPRKQRRLD